MSRAWVGLRGEQRERELSQNENHDVEVMYHRSARLYVSVEWKPTAVPGACELCSELCAMFASLQTRLERFSFLVTNRGWVCNIMSRTGLSSMDLTHL